MLKQIFNTLYCFVSSLRNKLYDKNIFSSYRSRLPVVCVGNISFGGSGKTPVTIFVCELLKKRGYRPVILSRGYAGTVAGIHCVSEGDTAERVGDEPLMMHQRLGGKTPIIISQDRVAGVQSIEQQKLGDVIVLDDGFQHRSLQRTVDILLLDAQDFTFNGKLSARCLLRESPRDALQRATFLGIIKKGKAKGQSSHVMSFEKPQAEITLLQTSLVDCYTGEEIPLSQTKVTIVTAVAAIAKPNSFFENIQQQGFKIQNTFSFRDHYHYAEEEYEGFLQGGLPLLTTEKDAVKLKRFVRAPGELYFVRQEVILDDAATAIFEKCLCF